jgi:hypothetical protein
MTDAQTEALQSLLRIAGVSALGGAGLRLGVGALRSGSSRYEPPKLPKPLVVDIPYPADDAAAAPLVAGRKPLPLDEAKDRAVYDRKAANDLTWAEQLMGWLNRNTPYTPLQGPANGQAGDIVPLAGAGVLPALGLGLGGGYAATDSLLRAAERRGARSDLETAKKDYQQSVLDRARNVYVGGKSAAAVVDGTQAGPELEAVKAAVDRAYAAAVKAADGPVGDFGDLATRIMFPGTLLGPEAAFGNMVVAGGVGGLGAYLGHQAVRDRAKADAVRKQVAALERDSTEESSPAVIGRLVPVARPQSPAMV